MIYTQFAPDNHAGMCDVPDDYHWEVLRGTNHEVKVRAFFFLDMDLFSHIHHFQRSRHRSLTDEPSRGPSERRWGGSVLVERARAWRER